MRAIRIHETKGPSHIVEEEVAAPEPGEGLIIDVRAAGVSFPDLLLTKGEYQIKPEPPFTLGSEGAGRVAYAPEGSGYSAGDRVAFLTLGAWAEQAVAAPMMTFPLPDEVSWQAGAALIINYHTALFALRDRGALAEGETVLVQGAAGGVGTAAIQIAKSMGAKVISVVSTDAKADVALTAGSDEVVFAGPDWVKRVKELSGGGVDMVVDPVGGERFTDNLRSLSEAGRVLVIGFADGTIPEVKVNRLLLRNTSVVGVAWGAYVGTRPALAQEIGEVVNEMAVDGSIDPIIGSVYNLEDASAAVASLEERTATGKVVLQISED